MESEAGAAEKILLFFTFTVGCFMGSWLVHLFKMLKITHSDADKWNKSRSGILHGFGSFTETQLKKLLFI